MTITANPPVELPLENLNPAQKWAVVQHLCADLVTNYEETIEPPAWHEAVLREREAKEARGEARFISLDEFAQRVRSRKSITSA